MYILAVETTGPLCSVALLEKNKILAVRSSKEQKNHLKDLMPLIKDLLDSVQIHKSKLHSGVYRTGVLYGNKDRSGDS